MTEAALAMTEGPVAMTEGAMTEEMCRDPRILGNFQG
jgi:hypothetical protein